MGIFADNIQTKTPEELKQISLDDAKREILALTTNTFRMLTIAQKQGIIKFWKNANLTPQEIGDALGTNTLNIFLFHRALNDFITTIAQLDGTDDKLDLAQPTHEFTFVDGLFVLGEPIEE